jgi:hypothetical protein
MPSYLADAQTGVSGAESAASPDAAPCSPLLMLHVHAPYSVRPPLTRAAVFFKKINEIWWDRLVPDLKIVDFWNSNLKILIKNKKSEKIM